MGTRKGSGNGSTAPTTRARSRECQPAPLGTPKPQPAGAPLFRLRSNTVAEPSTAPKGTQNHPKLPKPGVASPYPTLPAFPSPDLAFLCPDSGRKASPTTAATTRTAPTSGPPGSGTTSTAPSSATTSAKSLCPTERCRAKRRARALAPPKFPFSS